MHIETQTQLEQVCARAMHAGCIGIDLEFIPENTYYPQLALVQIAVEQDSYIVDPLGTLDLAPIEQIVTSDEVVKIVHAGMQDMAIFFNRTGRVPKRVFDTQLAAAFLGMGHQISYGSLVFNLCGVSLKKGQSYTNWLKRPLLPEQEKYALEDVAFLVEAYEKLQDALNENGRLEWVSSESFFYEDIQFYQVQPQNIAKKVKKTKQFYGKDQVVLEALALWREDEAQKRDLPRKKILSDNVIVDLAKRKPRNENELYSIRSVGHFVKKYATAILNVIDQSRNLPPAVEKSNPPVALDDEQKLLVDFLVFCLKAFCQKEQLSNIHVATKNEVEALVRDYMSDSFDAEQHKLLTGWRKDAVGVDMIKCLKGELGVKYNIDTGKLIFY